MDKEIQALSEAFVEEHSLPGVVMAIAQLDQPLRVGVAGVRKRKNTAPFSMQDQIHLGSNTKAMTATLAARLVEQQKIRFDSTIIEILPQLSNDIHKQYHAVTLEQLLTHQSAMPANPKDWWVDHGQAVSDIRWTIATTALKKKPKFSPGEDILYSNLGYMIAGLMLEAVGDATWEVLIAQEVFTPMALWSAGFGPPGNADDVSQPWGHRRDWKGSYIPKHIDNAPPLGPAGRVHMNIHDWAKFVMAHLSNGRTLNDESYLSDQSWDYLHTAVKDKFALGWMVVERGWAKGETYTHSGSNTFWYATVWVAPKLKRAYFVGTNAAGGKVATHVDKAVGNLIGL